jgi:hypothetical protein
MISELARNMGTLYVLDAIFTLEELKLPAFPRTATGKIRKDVLKSRVLDYTNAKEATPGLNSNSSTAERLVFIWQDLVGFQPTLTEPISRFADSITALRYCDRVWNTLSRKIYLGDFKEYQTIEKQGKLLDSRHSAHYETYPLVNNRKAGPPLLDDVVLANGKPERFEDIRSAANKVMSGLGLCWNNNTEDIIPIKDKFLHFAKGPRLQSYRHRMAFRVPNYDSATVCKALQKGILSRPMFRTLLGELPDKTLFHIVIRPSMEVLNKIITTIDVPDNMALQKALSDTKFSAIQMFQAVVVTILETETTAIIFTYNHSVFDALSVAPWYADLDRLIIDLDANIATRTPFKLYADWTYLYESSLPAKLSIEFNVRRLRGISNLTESFWPKICALGWVNTNDTEPTENRMQKQDSNSIKQLRAQRAVVIPYLETLRIEYDIEPSIVVKTALAIFNVNKTGQQYAIFNCLETGRKWPFAPFWIEQGLPPAMSIDGPTLEWALNKIRISSEETILDLLQRVRNEESETRQHLHCPMLQVLKELGEEARHVIEGTSHQSYNWDVSTGYIRGRLSDYATLEPAGRCDWPER